MVTHFQNRASYPISLKEYPQPSGSGIQGHFKKMGKVLGVERGKKEDS